MKKVSFAEKKSHECAKTHMGIFYAIVFTLVLIGAAKLIVSS